MSEGLPLRVGWSEGNFYSDQNAKNVRTLFTVSFWFISTGISFIGAKFLKRRSQYLLLRSKQNNIPLRYLSPWLTDAEAFKYYYRTRKLPGGIYGIVMLVSGVFTLTSHVLTSRYVSATTLPGRCLFTRGLNLTTPIERDLYSPPATWPSFYLALDAQSTAVKNGGQAGIYGLSAADTNFTASSEDVLASWTCAPHVMDPILVGGAQSDETILDNLIEAGLLYNASLWENQALQGDLEYQLFAWSAPVGPNVSATWDIRAFYTNTNLSMGDKNGSHPTTTTSFHCTLSNNKTAWLAIGAGLLQDVANVQPIIESILNAMMMVAGAGGGISNADSANATYGCLTQQTLIQPEIFIALGVMLVMFLPLCIVDLVYLLIIRCSFKDRKLVEDTPSGLASWQVATLRDVFHEDGKIMAKDVSKYVYGWLRAPRGGGMIVGYKRVTEAQSFHRKFSGHGLGQYEEITMNEFDTMSGTGTGRPPLPSYNSASKNPFTNQYPVYDRWGNWHN
ncbi:hypothetical protein MMC25_004224 [Agyrium rufum]|nr:hypothetical protein [Agyrium rufum]